ncbi:MAG: YbbR-like domain-containing protein [Tannerellaceae bacterium]|jgi:hypothetical protein|nr:YbbR-like domain-containing protein [Tannerellaceae bacterium]
MERLENIKQSFKSIQRKIKVLFRRRQWKEILIFLAFVLVSFGFWVLQSMQEEYEIQVTIPLRYRNLPPEIAFVQPPPAEITARVRDKGGVLLNYAITNKVSAIELNLKELHTDKSGTFVCTKSDLEGAIMKKLISTTSLLSFEPQQIQEPYSKLVKKSLPVVFNGNIQTEPGFVISKEIDITPPTVDVYASDVTLKTLQSVKMAYLEIKKAKRPVSRTAQLEEIAGATIEPAKVTVTVTIEEFTEKTLEVLLKSVDLPPDYTIRMFPSVVKLTCTAPLSRYMNLTEDDFAVEVSVAGADRNISGMLPVFLTKKPDWVEKVTVTPDSIEFILEQNSLND